MVPAKRCVGIRDRLFANALLIQNDREQLLVLSCDTCQIPEPVITRLKTAVANRFGISRRQFVITATHAHHTPDILGEEYIENRHQIDRLVSGCYRAIEACLADARQALLGWESIDVASAINRFQWRTGGNDVKRVDRRVDVLTIREESGDHRGLLWHYAAHPTCSLRDEYLISRDYYGEANSLVEEALGGFSIFVQGACANINLTVHKRTFEKSEFHGRHIGERIVSCSKQTLMSDNLEIDSDTKHIESPLTERVDQVDSDSDPAALKHYFRTLDRVEVDYDNSEAEFETMQVLRQRAQRHRFYEDFVVPDRTTETVEIQAVRIGDRLGVTIPGEPFVELQLDLATRFPGYRAMVIGYSNGHIGYIPDPESYEIESYETIPTYTKRAGKFAGQLMLEAGVELLSNLL